MTLLRWIFVLGCLTLLIGCHAHIPPKPPAAEVKPSDTHAPSSSGSNAGANRDAGDLADRAGGDSHRPVGVAARSAVDAGDSGSGSGPVDADGSGGNRPVPISDSTLGRTGIDPDSGGDDLRSVSAPAIHPSGIDIYHIRQNVTELAGWCLFAVCCGLTFALRLHPKPGV